MKRSEMVGALEGRDDAGLFDRADAVRRACCGETVFVRGIVEFSNCCVRDCLYCGLRRSNRRVRRYRMEHGEIVATARAVVAAGVRTVVLQSGDDLRYGRERLCRIVRDIKALDPAPAVTLSVGERPDDDYRALRDAGADRYLLRHETANEELYGELHPGQSLARRMRILELLRTLGYQVGCGFMVGLPGQTFERLAEDLLFLREFQPDMAGIGPFIPQSDTPLSRAAPGDTELTLRALALARIVTRDAHLPATTALATRDRAHGYSRGLRAGCNVVMFDATPGRYSRRYRIYDGKVASSLEEVRAGIARSGRTASGARGDSLKNACSGQGREARGGTASAAPP